MSLTLSAKGLDALADALPYVLLGHVGAAVTQQLLRMGQIAKFLIKPKAARINKVRMTRLRRIPRDRI
jgi:hypothetical protein